jgi:hypothetical protein
MFSESSPNEGSRRALSIDDELLDLARQRDQDVQTAISAMKLDEPHVLRSQLRAYLQRQVDRGHVRRAGGNVPEINTLGPDAVCLNCEELAFTSGSRLKFEIKLNRLQTGWVIRQFEFHVRLPSKRKVKMVRIDLNEADNWHDALRIPRCHLHVDDSEPHISFPVLDPRLLLHTMCERIEPYFGK